MGLCHYSACFLLPVHIKCEYLGACVPTSVDARRRRPEEIRGFQEANGRGIKNFFKKIWQKICETVVCPLFQVLPKAATWIRDSVVGFDPDSNVVRVGSGDELEYEFLVVAMGIQLNYKKVGLE